ncbi:MAG: 30S ribosomal protein S6 [Clostridia bacterium]
MNNYEVLYIIDNTLEDAAKEALIAKFSEIVTNDGGTVETIDKWGCKKLAYTIDYKTEGYYVLMNFTCNANIPAEIERVMKITDSIIRYMVIRK